MRHFLAQRYLVPAIQQVEALKISRVLRDEGCFLQERKVNVILEVFLLVKRGYFGEELLTGQVPKRVLNLRLCECRWCCCLRMRKRGFFVGCRGGGGIGAVSFRAGQPM